MRRKLNVWALTALISSPVPTAAKLDCSCSPKFNFSNPGLPPASWDSWKLPQEINNCNQGTTLKVMRYKMVNERKTLNKDASRNEIILLHVLCIRSTNCMHQEISLYCHIRLQGKYPFFWTKNSRTFQRRSRTHFLFSKDSIQCKKEPWVYVF